MSLDENKILNKKKTVKKRQNLLQGLNDKRMNEVAK